MVRYFALSLQYWDLYNMYLYNAYKYVTIISKNGNDFEGGCGGAYTMIIRRKESGKIVVTIKSQNKQ